jgi:hypothetical protein
VLCSFLLRDALIDLAHDDGFRYDHELLATELDLGFRSLPKQHAVTGLDVERMPLPSIGFSFSMSEAIAPPEVVTFYRARQIRARPRNGCDFIDGRLGPAF